jgi:2-polyprenyl-3-methyl-5-hydroxy-6-metoxy-1,4-benzoquinol methylase
MSEGNSTPEIEYVPCNLCGSADFRARYPATIPYGKMPADWSVYRCTNAGYGLHHTIVQCEQCGFVYTNPRWLGDQILHNYEAVEDPLYLQEREGRVLTFQHHLLPLQALTGPAGGRRLLDVGCYTGIFVEIAAAAGWDSWGIDPSSWAVSEAVRNGLQVVEGTLETAGFPDSHFDVVTLWDVIEHVSDPALELRQAHRLLRPGGLLVVHTMDIDSLVARLMGRRWPWLMEMHLYYFSQRTLREMVRRAGYQVIHSAAQGRYTRLAYLVTRIRAFSRPVAWGMQIAMKLLHLGGVAIPINLGDLFTLYARRSDAVE